MGARVRRAQLRRRAVEVRGAQDVLHLHFDVAVAARPGERYGAVGDGADALVVAAREEDRDPHTQRESPVRGVAHAFEQRQQAVDERDGVTVPPLEVGQFRAPRVDARREVFAGRRRGRARCRGVEVAQRACMVALPHRARRAREVEFDALAGGGLRRQRVQCATRDRDRLAKLARARALPGEGDGNGCGGSDGPVHAAYSDTTERAPGRAAGRKVADFDRSARDPERRVVAGSRMAAVIVARRSR